MKVVCFLLLVCVLRVVFAQHSQESSLEIRRPPTITKNPPAIIIYRSDRSITIDCAAQGIPAVTYEWKKNGFVINQTERNIQRGAGGTIRFESATAMNEGFYQCFAKNQFGTALSTVAHMQRAFLESSTGNAPTLQKMVQVGQPFHIEANQRRSVPIAKYGWVIAVDTVDKYQNPVHLSRRIQMAENGDLHFAYAVPEDGLRGGIYKSTVYNPHLDVKVGGSYTKLTVAGGNISQFPPIIGFASESPTVAVIGGSVTLACFFYGYPEPTISWSGPRNTLPIGRYEMNKFSTKFTINNIAAADEGEYSCTGTNDNGLKAHTLQIRVDALPRFRNPTDRPRDVNVTEGESFTFNCKADAKPDATIVWMKDGEELNLDHLPRFILSNDKRSLTIKDVCRDCVDRETKTDLMVIQCNASNVHGYIFGQGYLNVLSRTVVKIYKLTKVEVNVYGEGQVQFDCRAASDPSTPPTIRWYKLEPEGDMLLHNKPPILTITGGLLSIHVADNATDIWPKYIGQYKCVAMTGHSQVSETANVIGSDIFRLMSQARISEKMVIFNDRGVKGRFLFFYIFYQQ